MTRCSEREYRHGEYRTTVPARRVLLLGFVVVLAACNTPERLKIKRTTTNIVTLGKICQADQPEVVGRESLIRLAEKNGASGRDLLVDAWGNDIAVVRSSDARGVHYTVFSAGPGLGRSDRSKSYPSLPAEASQAAFIWQDGEWLREYDPRRGGLVEHR